MDLAKIAKIDIEIQNILTTNWFEMILLQN